MNNDVQSAIEVFKNRVREKEGELNRLKKAVNDMAVDAGLPPIYASVATEATETLSSIRSDLFYGQGLSTAIRMYLEMRKASGLGAGTVNEIYEAVKSGGYKFETRDEENAKTGVRNTLRKNTAQFHRLPNGEYGLLTWYPNAKAAKAEPEEEEDAKEEKTNGEAPPASIEFFENDQIREVIAQAMGNFRQIEIEKQLTDRFPSKQLYRGQLPAVIFALNKKGKLKVVSERQGTKGAVYCNV